jgi:6-phospho-3-hexuloisomerase
MRSDVGEGATTIHANDITVTQDRMHQFSGGLGHCLDPVSGVVGVGGDRMGVLQRVLALQGGRQLNVDRRGVIDLDLDHARFQGCQHPGHLEPRQPELLCDLDPRASLQVRASRNHPALEKLVWSHDAGSRHRIRRGRPAAVHLLFPRAGRSTTVNSLKLDQHEIASTLRLVDQDRLVELTVAFADRTRRWYVSGQGRYRLVASMAAMRLMHVGFDVHMTGEVTAPSIGEGDCLLMLSASGETLVSLHLARRAGEVGARVLAITTREDSSLAAIADAVVAVPAQNSRQFGGSLFEQASLIVLDALILDLTQDDPNAYEVMSRRHTNLE